MSRAFSGLLSCVLLAGCVDRSKPVDDGSGAYAAECVGVVEEVKGLCADFTARFQAAICRLEDVIGRCASDLEPVCSDGRAFSSRAALCEQDVEAWRCETGVDGDVEFAYCESGYDGEVIQVVATREHDDARNVRLTEVCVRSVGDVICWTSDPAREIVGASFVSGNVCQGNFVQPVFAMANSAIGSCEEE